jgi:sporulation protein YlmC with PRC-barrel domain
MNYAENDTYGMYKNENTGPGPELMGADTLIGNDVVNHMDEDLGDIKEIMLDMKSGKIAYAVLSFGGFMGMGDKLFAIPWDALMLDTQNKCFVLNVAKERLEAAPGFNREDWPDMNDPSWQNQIKSFYDTNQSGDRVGVYDGNQGAERRETPRQGANRL